MSISGVEMNTPLDAPRRASTQESSFFFFFLSSFFIFFFSYSFDVEMLRVVKTPGRKQEVAKGGLHDVASDMTQLLCIVCVCVCCVLRVRACTIAPSSSSLTTFMRLKTCASKQDEQKGWGGWGGGTVSR